MKEIQDDYAVVAQYVQYWQQFVCFCSASFYSIVFLRVRRVLGRFSCELAAGA